MNMNEMVQDRVYALAASPNFEADGTLLAAKQSGLYMSTDNGQSWRPAFASLGIERNLPTSAVAFSPCFAFDRTLFAAVEGNILRSTDGGESWQYAGLGEPPPIVSALAPAPTRVLDPDREGLILATTFEDGVLRSNSRGTRWARWNFGLLDSAIFSLAFTSDGRVFAGVESGIFSSSTGGRSWREVDFEMRLGPVLCLAVTDGALYAGTEANGLFRSTDGGETWQVLGFTGTVEQVLVDRERLLVVQPTGLIFSPDGGLTWEALEEFDAAPRCASAPFGLEAGAQFWIGLDNGQVVSQKLNR